MLDYMDHNNLDFDRNLIFKIRKFIVHNNISIPTYLFPTENILAIIIFNSCVAIYIGRNWKAYGMRIELIL